MKKGSNKGKDKSKSKSQSSKKNVILILVAVSLVLILAAVSAAAYFGYYVPQREQKISDYKKAVSAAEESLAEDLSSLDGMIQNAAETYSVPGNVEELDDDGLYELIKPSQLSVEVSNIGAKLDDLEESLEELEAIEDLSYKDAEEINEQKNDHISEASDILEKYQEIIEYYELALPIYKDFDAEIEEKPDMKPGGDEAAFREDMLAESARYQTLADTLKTIDAPESMKAEVDAYAQVLEAYAVYMEDHIDEEIARNKEYHALYLRYSPFTSQWEASQYQKEYKQLIKDTAYMYKAIDVRTEVEKNAYREILQHRFDIMTQEGNSSGGG